jgi:hypothetical protein
LIGRRRVAAGDRWLPAGAEIAPAAISTLAMSIVGVASFQALASPWAWNGTEWSIETTPNPPGASVIVLSSSDLRTVHSGRIVRR